jgi:hypothetical protein
MNMPEKWIWTEADFEEMGWHDATIHAIAFRPESYELLLDIDYIFRWIQPPEGESYFTFWVAPATIVFRNVYETCFDLEPLHGCSISDLIREEPGKPRNAEAIGRDTDWHWLIDCPKGSISFRAIGFEQFIRRAPVLSRQQHISEQDRGGFSFSYETPK